MTAAPGSATASGSSEAPALFRSRCRNRLTEHRAFWFRSMPRRHRFFCNPDREASSANQSGDIFRPIRHLVSGFRDLVTASRVEFIGHGDSKNPRKRSLPTIFRDPCHPSARRRNSKTAKPIHHTTFGIFAQQHSPPPLPQHPKRSPRRASAGIRINETTRPT